MIAEGSSLVYECEHRRRSVGCKRGFGKPLRRKCRRCGGRLLVWRWRSDGNYRLDDALRTARTEQLVDKLISPADGDTHCVRFIRDSTC